MINFDSPQAIYLQIADFMSEQILANEWVESERIPSIREVALMVQVNPNTVMRSFSLLQDQSVIFNKRGVGYFVSDDAVDRVKNIKKQSFIDDMLPKIFHEARVLDFSVDELSKSYQQYLLDANQTDKESTK